MYRSVILLSLCPIKACTVGKSTPLMTNQLAKVWRKSWKVKSALLAWCTACINAVQNDRYGSSVRVRNTGPSADVLILTVCNVAVNTSFIGTLRLSLFLIYAARRSLPDGGSRRLVRSARAALKPETQYASKAVITRGRSCGPQWASNFASSSGVRMRMRPLFSRANRTFLTGLSVAFPQVMTSCRGSAERPARG